MLKYDFEEICITVMDSISCKIFKMTGESTTFIASLFQSVHRHSKTHFYVRRALDRNMVSPFVIAGGKRELIADTTDVTATDDRHPKPRTEFSEHKIFSQ